MSLTLCHWLVPSVTTILHDLLLRYNWAVDFVLRFSVAMLSRQRYHRKTGKDVQAVIKYLYLKGMTPQEFFCDMKERWTSSKLIAGIICLDLS